MKVVQFLVIFVTFEISYILKNALESYRTVFLSGVKSSYNTSDSWEWDKRGLLKPSPGGLQSSQVFYTPDNSSPGCPAALVKADFWLDRKPRWIVALEDWDATPPERDSAADLLIGRCSIECKSPVEVYMYLWEAPGSPGKSVIW